MTRGAGKKRRRSMLTVDFMRSLSHSKGRFASILLLMMLGSFALVGLYVSGPNMRATGEAYFGEYTMADLSVISDYGLTDADEELLREAKGLDELELGYFKDVTIDGTTMALRLMSKPEHVSQLELVEGRMPQSADEIAIDWGLRDDYALGDELSVTEKPDSVSGGTVLTCTTYTIVGYVNTPEIISIVNMGQSTAGTGSLKGYAVAADEAFDSSVHMVARLTFTDTQGLSPYSSAYSEAVQAHKEELADLLEGRPEERLEEVASEYEESIAEGQSTLDDAKSQLTDASSQLSDAEGQLVDAQSQIDSARSQLDSAVDSGASQVQGGKSQLDAAWAELEAAKAQLDAASAQIESYQSQISAAQSQIAEGKLALTSAKAELTAAKSEYSQKKAQYDLAKSAYDASWESVSASWAEKRAAWEELDRERSLINAGIDDCQDRVDADSTDVQARVELVSWQQKLAQLSALDVAKAAYDELAEFDAQKDELASQLASAESQIAEAESTIEAKEAEVSAGESQLSEAQSALDAARSAYDAGNEQYQTALAAYTEATKTYASGAQTLATEQESALDQINAAEDELAAGQEEYDQKLEEYEEALPEAEEAIAQGEEDLASARERLERLAVPAYETDTRREALGSDAYRTYATIAEIVDSLARVFPVFLYLVAALVTLSTMTRMVEEERQVSGTLKALGYGKRAITRKFVAYGALAGGAGSLLGIALGHTLLPWIVYLAYGHAFTLPAMHLGFYPEISAIAFAAAMLCSVLPAWAAAHHELAEKPAQLLLPKPPKGGSTIMLEHVGPVWRRLSFTHKVTARNLFRYKQRMLMTVLGVAGAACMLVAGFGVQQSISKMGDRQFGELIRYDMIVAEQSGASEDELAEVEALLSKDDVASSVPLFYESVSRTGGANGDRQSITLLVPEDASGFGDYVQLVDRASGEALELPESGAVISERLATLFGLEVGDVFEFTAADGSGRYVRVAGITEMYMGHFMFMSRSAFEECYGEDFSSNAALVRLKDGSLDEVESKASEFMQLQGVKSVVQNTALQSQVNTVVTSLNMIMWVLIAVATLLGVVIMYNLTNLNVSERMRELSTIKVLGFNNRETTMYIYRETIILTALGVLVGYALGVALHEYILYVVPPDNVMFDPAVSWVEFAVPAVVLACVTGALYFVVRRRLRNVDMLEALKSVD